MYQANTIIYRKVPITKIGTLEKFNNIRFHLNDKTKTYLSDMLQYEQILYQGNTSPVKRLYSFENMLQVQGCMENLDLLEAIKYSEYIVNARKLLHKYLHSKYNLSSCNLLDQISDLSLKERFCYTDIITSTATLLSFDDEKNQPSPSKSIRMYLNHFLAMHTNDFSQIQCGLFTVPFSNKVIVPGYSEPSFDRLINTRLFLPAYKIPEFLLHFTFWDGRNFEHTASQINPNKLPPVNEKKHYSKYSYQIALNKFQELISEPEYLCPYKMCTLFRCDNIFLVYRLNALLYYYKLYLSDSFLDSMMQHYGFTYRQVIELKDTIINQIFKDEDFIMSGIKSKYFDFMLPFDIFYQYTVCNPISNTYPKNPRQFENDLNEIKHKVLDIWKTKFFLQCEFSFIDDGEFSFSISANETQILTRLTNNPFYEHYYLKENNFCRNFVSDDNPNFLSFDTIRKAVYTSGI